MCQLASGEDNVMLTVLSKDLGFVVQSDLGGFETCGCRNSSVSVPLEVSLCAVQLVACDRSRRIFLLAPAAQPNDEEERGGSHRNQGPAGDGGLP